MYLINTTTLELCPFMGRIPPYVILSHTWGDDEVTFDSIQNPESLDKASGGYWKIEKCCEQARNEGYEWAWVDTCCIDKRSSAELSEAINSMYRYYWEADKCYAYLSDVCVRHQPNSRLYVSTCPELQTSLPKNPPKRFVRRPHRTEDWPLPRTPLLTSSLSSEDIGILLKGSRWFTRGWTLQELLAPAVVEFYDMHWAFFGTKSNLATEIGQITDISVRHLKDRTSIKTASLGFRLSWASKRRTTRDEDIAYCLLGLVGVNMPLLYGEGKRAFRRLQVELLKQTRDHTMLAWSGHGHWARGPMNVAFVAQSILAPSPTCFKASALGNVRPTFFQPLAERSVQEMTALGLHIVLPCIAGVTSDHVIAVLDCSAEDSNRIGIKLAKLSDGRYERFEGAPLEGVSPEQVKKAVTQELYIVDEDLKETIWKEEPCCAFKVGSLTVDDVLTSDIRGYVVDIYTRVDETTTQRKRQPTRNVRAFCNEIVKLESSQVVCFTITLGSVNVMVLSRDYDGHCLLKALLSDYELNMAETEALIRGFSVDMSPEHLRDNITASRGTELWVEVVAERKLLNDQQYMDPCWQLMIHIGAGSAMP